MSLLPCEWLGLCPGLLKTVACLQDVLYDSDTQASLYLANLVEGTYLFQLRVTDAQGRSSAAMATVEVRAGGRDSFFFLTTSDDSEGGKR